MLTDSNLLIVLLSFFIDAIIDVFVFISLHLYVHKHHFDRMKPSKKILEDIFKIQGQRIILSGIYFIIAGGLHFLFLILGLERTIAFLISYLFALIITRSVHTIYGLKVGLFKPI